MKVLVLALFVACATAQYFPYASYPYYNGWYGRYLPGFYSAPTASQYHAQDALGQASYGYAYPGQAATNYRDAFGNQVGSYAYINPEGKEVRVSYVADANGFRVLSNDLPVAPAAPVAAPLQAPIFDGKAPEPVQDTAEVAAAKAEFFRLFKEAAIAAEAAPESRKKRQILSVLPANKQFADDLHWQSVDLNQDGQPDVPVYPVAAPVVAAPYAFPAVAAPFAAPVAAPIVAPAVAKYQVKSTVLEANEKAKTPSATTKLDAKEITQDFVAPLAYPAFGYPFAPAVIATPAAEKKTESRKKRQIPVFPAYRSQFYNDLLYNSVDLNKDGQPDKAVFAAPAPLPSFYSLPYNYGFPFYG